MVTHWSLVSKSAELRVLGQGVFMVLVLLILFFVFSFSEKLKKKMDVLFEKFPGGAFLKKFHGDVYSYRNMIWVLVVGVALSLVSQSFMVFTFLVVESALGSDLPVAAFFFVVPISTIATALPISPAGIGVGQAVLTFLFSWYFGHQSTMGAMGVTIFQIMLFILGLVGAVIYLKRKSLGAR
jgi:glycosyltransferase 2 family protein